MRSIAPFLLVAAFLLIAAATTCGAETPANTSGLPFLQIDTDYHVQFPDHIKAFTRISSSVDYGKTSSGQRIPVTTKVTHVVTVFTIRELGPSQWALLEHPSSLSDAATWNLQRTSAAKLNSQNIKKLQSTDDGKKRLEDLRRYAKNSVDTTQTWVNLAHAFAISPLPTEDTRPKISVNVTIGKRNSD
ncbi:hypothetical protein CA13_11120 [Planctomycetes bacterium CA13]|uniref:Uncharacterized protein n=1 Tax=Novipirellula herctigrandis TaxID=2527986 RepID=A0A5C5YXE3_9BACT|nr:hypothetical protein CA13_11120 [Planctomycetes bacterium CA13]